MPNKYHDIFMDDEDFEKARQARLRQKQCPALPADKDAACIGGRCCQSMTGRSIKQITFKIGIKRSE